MSRRMMGIGLMELWLLTNNKSVSSPSLTFSSLDKIREKKAGGNMKTIGNLLWFIFGGFFGGLSWLAAGCIWCITIIGIPIGLQCFKLAGLSFWPFGKEVVYDSSNGMSLILNLFWLIFSGIPLAIGHVVSGLILCITIIGIPFGQQSFKLAKLALMPFGARVVSRRDWGY